MTNNTWFCGMCGSSNKAARCACGNVKPNSALSYRVQAFERAALIAALGFKPEAPVAADRYAATAGEMRGWLRADHAAHVVEYIEAKGREVR